MNRRIADPRRLQEALSIVPYKLGGNDWGGVDCWGLVELWYLNRFEITLSDRRSIKPGPAGLSEGFAGSFGRNWIETGYPKPDCVVIMRRSTRRSIVLEHGHCGIVAMQGQLLHTEDGSGVRLEPLIGENIRNRITGFFEYKNCTAPGEGAR